jgi:hypothetical protein
MCERNAGAKQCLLSEEFAQSAGLEMDAIVESERKDGRGQSNPWRLLLVPLLDVTH